MKYGVEISQRSVPEWKAHNIDYNEIKGLIKRATTIREGASNSSKKKTFDKVYQALQVEFDSVNLFVRSKSGEIDRRIDDCEKIVDALASQEDSTELSGFNSKTRQAKLFRLHQEITKLSRDIQSLARFVGVQRTGFRKLLKKYKKWSGSNELDAKFRPVLESPDSFVFEEFTSKFLELSLLYEVLRQAKFTSVRTQLPANLPHSSFTKFDCDVVTTVTNSSKYWVHPDNFVELQVTLLKSLTVYQTDVPKLRHMHSQLQLSRHNSTNNFAALASNSTGASNHHDVPLPDKTHIIYLDGPNFRSAQTAREPGQIHWADGDKHSDPVLCAPVGGLRYFTSMNLTHNQFDSICANNIKDIEDPENDNAARLALGWLRKVDASPVSEETCERTRFISSPEDKSGTVWAALDKNIRIKDLQAKNATDVKSFPYAVLDIRWTGNSKPSIVCDLDRAHLVQKMPNFSIYAHSVALFHNEMLESNPSWLQMLDDDVDIRKTPVPKPALGKRASTKSLRRTAKNNSDIESLTPGILLNDSANERLKPANNVYTRSGSTTSVITSDDSSTTPAISPLSQMNTTLRSSDRRRNNAQEEQQGGKLEFRYWNEFDNPEEGEDFGAFFVNNDEEQEGIFSDNNIDAIVDFSSKIIKQLGKIKNVFRYEKRGERAPLLHNSDEEFDEEDEADFNSEAGSYSPRFQPRRSRGYSAATYDTDMDKSTYPGKRDRVLTALYSVCFVFSALMTAVLFGVILGEDMSEVTTATFVFTIIGLIFALAIGILGMCFFMLRETPGWAHQTVVFTTFFSIICFGVGGVCWTLVSFSIPYNK